jgi:HlyD family secretion protein
VMGLQITAPGMVLRAVEPALYVIPQNRAFVVNARIAPTDIDEVSPGQAATLRIAAFDSRRVPDLVGRLLTVSPDTFVDQNHASSYYRAEIEIPAAEIAKLSPAPLVPGMPAEVFLRTRDRTALSYLLEPLFAFFHRALRES